MLTKWKHRLRLESAHAALCKSALCTPQTFLSKICANSLNMFAQKSIDTYLLLTRVRNRINHISICFLPQYQHQRKLFFQSAKRHCATHWHKQCGMDSYQQQQISQSDCKISSNCGEIILFSFNNNVGMSSLIFVLKCLKKLILIRTCHWFVLINVLNNQLLSAWKWCDQFFDIIIIPILLINKIMFSVFIAYGCS